MILLLTIWIVVQRKRRRKGRKKLELRQRSLSTGPCDESYRSNEHDTTGHGVNSYSSIGGNAKVYTYTSVEVPLFSRATDSIGSPRQNGNSTVSELHSSHVEHELEGHCPRI